MSSRKNQNNLNISGFSPIQGNFSKCFLNQSNLKSNLISVNINSPSSFKSPGKDYGINERIEVCREKSISGFERWRLAEANGLQCINIIHNLKDKARRSGESPYPTELENYCIKLKAAGIVLEDVMKSADEFRKEMVRSLKLLESMHDNEELKSRLEVIRKFLDTLIQLYESSLRIKQCVIGELIHYVWNVPSSYLHPAENIAHTATLEESHLLIASWSCHKNHNEMFKLITQLKISPNDHRWVIS